VRDESIDREVEGFGEPGDRIACSEHAAACSRADSCARRQYRADRRGSAGVGCSRGAVDAGTEPEPTPQLTPELAFYRKYTEALLRRYLRLSMQSGRVPSLLSRNLFRGHVTRYNVRSFEEVVIFCHDVEQRLARLNATEKQIIAKVVLQRYSLEEAAGMLSVSVNTLRERYRATIDRLTGMLLEAKLLDPQRP
jgi:hypothetical protein